MGAGARDIGLVGQDVLLAAFQFELVGLAGPQRRVGASNLGAGRFDVLLARTFHDQREPLVGLAQHGGGAVEPHAVLVVLLFRNVVVLEQILRAIPVGLRLIVLGLGVGDGGARLLNLLRP